MIIKDTEEYIAWVGGAAVDADGSPFCYHPNSKKGLDNLLNAGKPGAWYGIVVDLNGDPLVQGPNDPAPGFYISCTSLVDKGYKISDPRRYVDAETIPYVVVPKDGIKERGVKLGDICLVYNKSSDLYCPGIVAEAGPRGHWNGELSIAMAKAIGISNTSPRKGGVSKGITYLVFKKSTKGWPRPQAEINDQAEALLATFGGIEKVKALK